MGDERLDRRQFLRLAAAGAVCAAGPDWSTNLGYPGYTNAAVDDVFSQFLIPKMVATAARGEMTAEEAVKATEARMKPIYDQWRERGKI